MVSHDHVTGLVIGESGEFVRREDVTPALGSDQHPLHCLVEILRRDHPSVTADGEQGGLVDHAGQIGAAEARSGSGDSLEVDVGFEAAALGVQLEHFEPTGHVGRLDEDVAVEATRAKEGGVENVGPVGGSDHDDAEAG